MSRNFRDRTARCRRMAFSSSLAAARRMLRWRSRGSAGARSSPVRWAVRKAKTLTVIVCSALLNGDRRTVENDPLVSSPGDTRHLFFGMPAPASLRLMGGNSAEVIAAIFDKAADDMVRKRRRPGQALRRSSSSSFATLAAMRRALSRWKIHLLDAGTQAILKLEFATRQCRLCEPSWRRRKLDDVGENACERHGHAVKEPPGS